VPRKRAGSVERWSRWWMDAATKAASFSSSSPLAVGNELVGVTASPSSMRRMLAVANVEIEETAGFDVSFAELGDRLASFRP
jgi:hypothetical protein